MARAAVKDGKVWYQREGDEHPIQMSCGLIHVFLDGEEERHAMAADEERGEVIVAVQGPRKTRLISDYIIDPFSPYGVKTETKTGKVEIRPDPRAQEILDGTLPRGAWRESVR